MSYQIIVILFFLAVFYLLANILYAVLSRPRKRRRKKQNYRALRRAEYPPVGDQLDAIMKWAATEREIGLPAKLRSIACQCMAVKSKYPKPEKE